MLCRGCSTTVRTVICVGNRRIESSAISPSPTAIALQLSRDEAARWQDNPFSDIEWCSEDSAPSFEPDVETPDFEPVITPDREEWTYSFADFTLRGDGMYVVDTDN